MAKKKRNAQLLSQRSRRRQEIESIHIKNQEKAAKQADNDKDVSDSVSKASDAPADKKDDKKATPAKRKKAAAKKTK